MMTRHLLPNELDLLIDGDSGFGLAPLKAHVETCSECRERVEALRAVTKHLDVLPHFSPRGGFADRVMSNVHVIEPWHVALAESATKLIPQSTPMRILAAAGLGVTATAISGGTLWLASRSDVTAWVYRVALDGGREGFLGLLGDAARALGAAPQNNVALLGAGIAVLALSTVAALFGFRRLAATARSQQG